MICFSERKGYGGYVIMILKRYNLFFVSNRGDDDDSNGNLILSKSPLINHLLVEGLLEYCLPPTILQPERDEKYIEP
jgi:hypothetical protein